MARFSADARQARRRAAQSAGQRQQGHRRAGRAQRPGGRPGAGHQRAAGPAAERKAPRWTRSPATSPRSPSRSRASSPRTARTLKPALDKLNGVLAIVDNRKERDAEGASRGSTPMRCHSVSRWRRARSSRPTSPTCCPASSSSRSSTPRSPISVWTPTCCCRRSCTDPQTGQPGTPALPVPYPRTGQGGEPQLNLPDAITGKPGDQGCGPPGLALPGPPAATRTGSRCRHRRPAARRRDRRRGTPPAPTPDTGRTPDPTSAAPVPGTGEPPRRQASESRPRKPQDRAGAPSLVLVLVGGTGRARSRWSTAGQTRTTWSRLLRQQQRHLCRRRGAHPRRAGRQDRQDRAAARSASRSRSGSTTSTRCPPTPRR